MSILAPPSAARPLRRMTAHLALGALLLVGCAKSCQKTSGPAAARDDLAMVPRETDIVVMANVKRARASVMWKKLIDLRDKDAAAKKQYDDFVKKCQIDPLQQIDSVFLALPQNTAETREFAVLARGGFDASRLLECVKTTAKESGKEVVETTHGSRKLLSVPGQEGFFAVVSPKIILLGGKEWAKKVLDLADEKTPGAGAKDNAPLADLIKRTRTGDAVWGAGLVSPAVAEKLKAQVQLGAAGSLKSVAAALDFDKGMTVHLNLDLGGDKDAAELSGKINEQLQNARKDRNVQLLGLSSYFDTIKVESKQSALSARIELSQPQVDDLSTRLSGLLKTLEMRGGGGLPELPAGK
jgi:hypothetical protein